MIAVPSNAAIIAITVPVLEILVDCTGSDGKSLTDHESSVIANPFVLVIPNQPRSIATNISVTHSAACRPPFATVAIASTSISAKLLGSAPSDGGVITQSNAVIAATMVITIPRTSLSSLMY